MSRDNLRNPRGSRRRLLVVLFGVLAAVVAWAAYFRGGREVLRPRNVVLIVVDALRADHLGCYGYTRTIDGRKVSLSPNIDRFSRTGTLFEQCYSQSSWTATSMASMLYTINPTVHTAGHGYDYLEGAPPAHCLIGNIGQAFIERDYEKINVQTNPFVLDSLFTVMFDRIVHAVDHPFRKTPDKMIKGMDVRYANAAEVNEHAFEAVEYCLGKERNFVLYLHYMDVHEPYLWREPYRSVFNDGASETQDYAILRRDAPTEAEGGYGDEFAQKLQWFTNDYDASIMYFDKCFGELMAFLERKDLLDDTLVIFAADHGQSLGEHGTVGHGSTLYSEQIHVPLVISGGAMPADVRVPGLVANVDILPTIGEYIELYPKSHGIDLSAAAAAAALNNAVPDRAVYACADFTPTVIEDRMKLMVVAPGRLKYIATRDKEGRTIGEELYCLLDDPGEQNDVSAEKPDELEACRALLREFHDGGYHPDSEGATGMSPLVKARLRALGYLQ